ncbi:hypothetical protein D9M71_434070 [compost metagenome]
MKKVVFATLISLFWSNLLLAKPNENYLCIPNYSTGYTFDKNSKTWSPTNFSTTNTKYMLSISEGKGSWKIFGTSDFISACEVAPNTAYVACNGLSKVHFNKNNLRFISSYQIGYVDSNESALGAEGETLPTWKLEPALNSKLS